MSITKKKWKQQHLNERSDKGSMSKNQNKRLRMIGKEYKGQKKVNNLYEFCIERTERILTPSKCSKRCEKSKVINCTQMTEVYR